MINTPKTKQVLTGVQFKADFQTPHPIWCCYSHSLKKPGDDKPTMMWVGSCRFLKLFDAPDARRNETWREHVLPHKDVIVEVHAIADSGFETMNHAFHLVRMFKPYCNIHGVQTRNNGWVRCLQDGLEFNTQSAAAKHYGITPGAMSNHLNKIPGYETIHGFRFERIKHE